MRNTPSDVFVRAAFALAVAAITTHATAQNTSAALSGSVTGSDGRPVSGATVSITHKESGTTTKVLTDGSGRFSARGLRVGGPYLMTAEKEGVVERKDDIYLSLAETASFSFSIGQSQSVTVTASTGYDVFQNRAMGAGTQLSAIEVASLPTVQRSIQDVARLDPRFAFTDRERGEISMAGMNPRYNSYTVDGLSIADSFGLEPNQLPMLKQPVPMDAIQNVQINASNYDVSQKGYVGANVNAVTKSGTNEVKGSVYYGFRDQGLTGERYNRTNDTYFATPPFKESFKGFTLGGPLITDKLFFFVAYDEFASSRSIPDFGPVGSSKTNVGITQDAIDQVVSLAKSKYGLNLGSISASPGNAELKDMLLKLDWSIADGHRASLRYSRTEQVEPLPQNFFSSNTGSGLGLSSDWYIQNKKLDSIVGQWFADWSAVFSTEVKASKRNYDSVPTPFEGGRMPYMQFQFQGALPAGLPAGFSTVQRTLYAGTERSRHTNVLKTDTSDVYAAGNYLAGEHEIKFGADWADNKIYNAFLQDTIGNYTFRCENGNYSFGAVTCSSASADTVLRAMLENFQNGRPSGYSTQVAFPGRTLDDAIAQWSYQNTGAFIQDTWRPMPRLELMAGVRIDSLGVSQSPLANKAALTAFGYDNTTTLDGKKLFQPRLGFNWDLSQSAQKMQLRGGWGLFQGTAPTVWLSNPFSNTGMASGIVNCASASACSTGNIRFNPDPNAQPTIAGTPPAQNVDFISPGLNLPSVRKATLALDAQLPALPYIGPVVASVEYLQTDVRTGIYYENLNLGSPTAKGLDGRDLFWNSFGLNTNCWTVTGSNNNNGVGCAGSVDSRTNRNRAFNNVLLARETSLGGSGAFTMSVVSPVRSGFGWGAAYTRASATEVSPVTSSVANSNWTSRNIFNPNEQVVQNSNYLIKDRFSANAIWSKPYFGNLRSTVGVFWEYRKGKPYSWTYGNDLNGDGQPNDLMYIPKAPGSGEVVFRGGAAEEARFWEIVNANPALANAKGTIAGRNNSFAPWVNTFDLRMSQELPGFRGSQRATIVLDILNVGNLLNKRWGRIDEVAFPSRRSFVNYNGVDAQGRYVYSLANTVSDLTTRQTAGESQWAAQVTLRYSF